jgi:SHS2 domain-containing protein
MPSHGYEEVDHTADIALRIWGENFQVLLQQAADGMYDLMGVIAEPGSHREARFDLSYGTNETLLVDFLSELLYLSEEKGLALKNFTFFERDEKFIVQASGGVIISQDRHIKAVTFHDLDIEIDDGGLEATITFDV